MLLNQSACTNKMYVYKCIHLYIYVHMYVFSIQSVYMLKYLV